ncbi:MAG: internal scaffolding protein [Microviridae sp.]|nr:MAG: internal scaffolding protein [Microviridae sp.]
MPGNKRSALVSNRLPHSKEFQMSSNPNNPRPISTSQPLILSTYSQKKPYKISFPQNSKHTKQEFKEECDINTIMKRYELTGELPNISEVAPQYLDVSAGVDFQQSMEFVAGANSLFGEMPSAIRNKFNNDPREFVEFCSLEKNRPELAEMGLLNVKPPQPIPTPTPLPKTQPDAIASESVSPPG